MGFIRFLGDDATHDHIEPFLPFPFPHQHQKSHRLHHMYHNHLTKDMSHPWMTKASRVLSFV